ncbi:hypothetical protein F5887DRAFT_1074901 [Amanita rubescens]|nr:hypothetical protein F5887DRAFT_1074901 [Amanita rubescens]
MKFKLHKPNATANLVAVPAAPEQHLPSPFMDLPVEVHQHIIAQFLSDFYTTFEEIKALRLVCRRFNAIVAPRVYSHIDAFKFNYDDVVANMRQLLTLLSSKPSEQLHATTTLTISDLTWVDQTSPLIPFSELPFLNLLVNPVIAVNYYLIRPILFPQVVPTAILHSALCNYARLKLYITPRFNLPNVTHVIWHLGVYDRKWTMSRTVKVLQQLPQLNELTLDMYETLDKFSHLVKCVSKLHHLHKLKFKFYYPRPLCGDDYRSPHVNAIGKIIAANPNLTHLEVAQCTGANNLDFGRMLRYIPADRPLKLEHISISHSCWHLAGLIPHIRSLTSVYLPDSRLLKKLLPESIFPPTMTLRFMDEPAIEYLDRHPQIVSLTFYHCSEEQHGETILKILSRHSETLTHLGSTVWYFIDFISRIECELALLQCTNLKQLVIYCRKNSNLTNVTPEMEAALSVISRLPDSLTVVITEAAACEAYIKYCKGSSNPLLRDLARRTVYEYRWYY